MDGGSRARRLWDGARRLPRGGVIAVAAGFLLHLSLGIMYTYGNLTTYLTSYLHVRLGLSVDYGDTMWIGAVQSICQGPGVLLGSVCCRRFGPRLTILAGSVLCSVGMALTCLTVQTSFATTTLSYGLMSGVGIGLAYTSPLMVGYQWFPHNRGVVSGVVVGGYGLGSIILTSVQTSYLNPENVSPEDDGFFHDDALLDRVPSLFLIQGAICAALQLCGVLGVRRPPPGHGEKLSEETEVKSDAPGAKDAGDSLPEKLGIAEDPEEDDPKAWRKHLLTIQTLQLLLGFVMNAYGMGTVNSFWKAFGQTFIKDDHFLAMVGIGSSVFNMLGRMVWGLVCDAWGYKPTMVAITGLLGALLFTFPSTDKRR
ncbi:MFS-type transporter AFUA_1G00970-like [Amphibalanus amphitrite]|uniref:MFS-type transporter AFUA_1G00970-like n=1 Tax=Amphibalanus amphitrite TaxID=1232801 RepID=UPI001C9126C8|nr:MFS-type transporter AFUA_1G00970-like [Amphibalanus amphitrite]